MRRMPSSSWWPSRSSACSIQPDASPQRPASRARRRVRRTGDRRRGGRHEPHLPAGAGRPRGTAAAAVGAARRVDIARHPCSSRCSPAPTSANATRSSTPRSRPTSNCSAPDTVGQVLTVDLNDVFDELTPDGLRLAVAQIVSTATEIGGVRSVQLRVDGETPGVAAGQRRTHRSTAHRSTTIPASSNRPSPRSRPSHRRSGEPSALELAAVGVGRPTRSLVALAMAWDSSRPVPWNRLIREWLIYAAIMSAVFIIFFRGDNIVGRDRRRADQRAALSGVRGHHGQVRLSADATEGRPSGPRRSRRTATDSAAGTAGERGTTVETRADQSHRGRGQPTEAVEPKEALMTTTVDRPALCHRDRCRYHRRPQPRRLRRRTAGGRCLPGVRAALSLTRLGRARRDRDLGRGLRHAATGRRRGRCRERGGDRHHQPARDDARLEPLDWRALRHRDRLAGPAYRCPL